MTREGAWSLADKASRFGWKSFGRRVDLDGAESWLRAPTSGPGVVQAFLKPSVGPNGSLVLTSPPGRFGADGAYTVVAEKAAAYAARAPIHEVFHVYLDDEGVLRTDHVLKLWRATAVRLHYRLTPIG